VIIKNREELEAKLKDQGSYSIGNKCKITYEEENGQQWFKVWKGESVRKKSLVFANLIPYIEQIK